jgi:hypothetical protein
MIRLETLSLLTRDGVRLDADVYRPESDEKLPILLMRQPYGRKIASTVVYAHPHWYASQGYIVVIQDVRGRGTSEGDFCLFAHEVEDGEDTLAWLANLPGSTGEVGMYGFSYQGMTQLYASVSLAPNLKALCPAMIAWDLYRDWATENGAFCLQMNLGWAVQLAAASAQRQGDIFAFQELYQRSRQLSFTDICPANPAWFRRLAPDSFYHDWLRYPADHDYWRNLSPQFLCESVDLPMLHIGGWFDPHLRGNLAGFQAMSQRSSLQKLVIGPWGHLPWGRKGGGMDYGPQAVSKIDELQIAWFNAILKGQDNGLLAKPSVQVFELGSNRWLARADFSTSTGENWYLNSTGLASVQETAGQFGPEQPLQFNVDRLVHDPWRPVPSLAGHASVPWGQGERSVLDGRADVLTYTSAPLNEPVSLLGIPEVFLEVTSDTPSFDLSVVLAEVRPDGSVYNLSQGYGRFASDPQPRVHFPLQALAACIPSGHCLRLSISGASFPAYDVNPGTGQSSTEAGLIDQQVITLTLALGNSYCRLPIGPGG